MMPAHQSQIEGGLMGLLVGDAVGVPYEFHEPGELPPAAQIEMEPPPRFQRAHVGVPAGTWSDDGAHALCLLESLIAGLRDGIEAIPERWRTHLRGRDLVEPLLAELLRHCATKESTC